MLYRCLKLHAGAFKTAGDVKGYPHEGIGQRHSGGISDGLGDVADSLPVVQGGLEVSDAEVEHMQWAEKLHLAAGTVVFLGNRQASFQGGTRRLAHAMREDQRQSQGRLKLHLLAPTAKGIVEREKRPLRPAMTFSHQGHRQKSRRGGGGQTNADRYVAFVAKAPFQSGPHVTEIEMGRRSFWRVRQRRRFRKALL